MDELRTALERYYELFGTGYPNIQLGENIEMINRCIETGIQAEDLYADKLLDEVEY